MCQKGEGPMLIGLRVRFWYGKFGKAEGRTADPSTALRFGRDDKGEGGAFSEERLVDDWNSRSLHFATLRSG